MPRKAITASDSEIKELYDPDYFYEHGSNPAYKKYIDIASENIYDGESPDYRSYIKDNRQRSLLALTWDQFLQNQVKAYTATRAVAIFGLSVGVFYRSVQFVQKHMPIGQHGIRNVRQTQLFRLYGAFPCLVLSTFPIISAWGMLNCGAFAAKKVYHHAILGERCWIHEHQRWNHSAQNYYFNDSPMSCEESFPDIARGLLAMKKSDELMATPDSMKS